MISRTSAPGLALPCQTDAFQVTFLIFVFGEGAPAWTNVTLAAESGDSSGQSSYGNPVSGVTYSGVGVSGNIAAVPFSGSTAGPGSLDINMPHSTVTATIPINGLSNVLHYYRIHATSTANSNNFYFTFETGCSTTTTTTTSTNAGMGGSWAAGALSGFWCEPSASISRGSPCSTALARSQDNTCGVIASVRSS